MSFANLTKVTIAKELCKVIPMIIQEASLLGFWDFLLPPTNLGRRVLNFKEQRKYYSTKTRIMQAHFLPRLHLDHVLRHNYHKYNFCQIIQDQIYDDHKMNNLG